MIRFIKKIIPNSVLDAYHFIWPIIGSVIYGFPSKRIKVVGVTGTNGKSTTVYLIGRILEKAGFKTAALSSIEFKVGEKIEANKTGLTIPGRLAVQKFLHRAVKNNCEYAVLEMTSEGMKQHRHRLIDFDAAVFTNLTNEHLERHGGFENYKKAKGRLFSSLKNGKIFVNLDDDEAKYFLSFDAKEKVGYGLNLGHDGIRSILAKDCVVNRNGVSFSCEGRRFNLKLTGEFNIYNALAAISVCLSEGVSIDDVRSALEEINGIPGRMEYVARDPFAVIVDYAHTPDSLEKVYITLRAECRGKMIGVLGAAGGGRDKWKRPIMGKIAKKYLDIAIVTSEDPYDEDPEEIIDQVISGNDFEKIVGRGDAIRRAISLASEGDVVIITGKGCEPWLKVGSMKIPWDDREEARKVLYGHN